VKNYNTFGRRGEMKEEENEGKGILGIGVEESCRGADYEYLICM
jgi:hypothetical protein